MKTFCQTYRLKDGVTNTQLKQALLQATAKCGATVFASGEHLFYPRGYTAFVILGESHSALHTFPEKKEVWVELVSCSDKIDSDKFFISFNELIQ